MPGKKNVKSTELEQKASKVLLDLDSEVKVEPRSSHNENKGLAKQKFLRTWDSLKQILEKNLRMSGEYDNIQEIQKILVKINPDTLHEESTRNLIKILHDLDDLSTQISYGLHTFIKTDNPRKALKEQLDTGQEGARLREDIDPKILNFIAAQRDAVALEIGERNAKLQTEYLKRLQDKYPNHRIELVLLKRHEVSTNLFKAGSFNPDTGLDALNFKLSSQMNAMGMPVTGQTPFHLVTAKVVQSVQMEYMRESGVVAHVDMMVSPVQRSHETARHATLSLEHEQVERVFISSCFAERQHEFGLFSSSARASKKPSEVAQEFLRPLDCEAATGIESKEFNNQDRPKLSYADDELLGYESSWAYKKRIKKVYDYTFTPLKTTPGGVSVLILVTHGGLNKDLIKYIKEMDKAIAKNFPKVPDHLDFGSQYQFVVVRDQQGKKVAIEYIGIRDRHGALQTPTERPVMLEDRITKLETAIEEKVIDGEKLDERRLAKALFKYCLLEGDNIAVTEKICEDAHGILMLNNLNDLPKVSRWLERERLPLPKETLLLRKEFLIENLLNYELASLGQRKKKHETDGKMMALGLGVLHTFTGKEYIKQEDFLKALKVNNQFVGSAQLKGLLTEAQKTFTKGKVINLIEAVLNLQIEKEALVAQAGHEARPPSP